MMEEPETVEEFDKAMIALGTKLMIYSVPGNDPPYDIDTFSTPSGTDDSWRLYRDWLENNRERRMALLRYLAEEGRFSR
jgi:hypothetical protein